MEFLSRLLTKQTRVNANETPVHSRGCHWALMYCLSSVIEHSHYGGMNNKSSLQLNSLKPITTKTPSMVFCFFLDLSHFDVRKERVIPPISTGKGQFTLNEM